MPITLKPAAISDATLLLEYMETYYRYDHLDFDPGKAATALDGLLRDTLLGRVWLVQQDDLTAGYVVLAFGYSLEFHGRDAFVDELFLLDEFRGQGIGAQVLALVEHEAQRLGVTALHLEVERTNTRAQALYRKHGFVDHDRYLMTRRLKPAGSP